MSNLQRPAGAPGIFASKVEVAYRADEDSWYARCQLVGLLVGVGPCKTHDEACLKLHYAASGAFDGLCAQWNETQSRIAKEFTEPQGLIKAV